MIRTVVIAKKKKKKEPHISFDPGFKWFGFIHRS